MKIRRKIDGQQADRLNILSGRLSRRHSVDTFAVVLAEFVTGVGQGFYRITVFHELSNSE